MKIKYIMGTQIERPRFDQHRDCFDLIRQYMTSSMPYRDCGDRLCALYGLRRTGKTVMMQQYIYEMSPEEKERTIYVRCNEEMDMDELENLMGDLWNKGVRNFFLDEITLLPDFQGLSGILSDTYSANGGRVVIAGTDSLAIALANLDKLLGRAIFIHTTRVPYAEYNKLTGRGLDEYIEKGGTLDDDQTYYDREHRDIYLNDAIANNIVNSLERGYAWRKHWHPLTADYSPEELVSVIQKMVNQFSYNLVADRMNRVYKNVPLLKVKRDLKIRAKSPEDIVKTEDVTRRVKEQLEILNPEEIRTKFTDEALEKLKNYLKKMDVFMEIPRVDSLRSYDKPDIMDVIVHPGLVYTHAKELAATLAQDDAWREDSPLDEERIQELRAGITFRAPNFVKGQLLERIVLAESYLALTERDAMVGNDLGRFYVSQLRVDNDTVGYSGEKEHEADLIVVDRTQDKSFLFEVKHSDKIVSDQVKHLTNEDFLSYVEENFAPVAGRGVIYRGPSTDEEDAVEVPYFNAADFLSLIHDIMLMREVERNGNEKLPDSFDFAESVAAKFFAQWGQGEEGGKGEVDLD